VDFDLSFDLISDLHLSKTEQFDWTGKPTSLFCVVAGGISSDLVVVKQTLEHLSTMYRGVFYIDSSHEHLEFSKYQDRISELIDICKNITNTIYMHNHVVILHDVAMISVNGWYAEQNVAKLKDLREINGYKNEDISYLSKTIRNLQQTDEVKKIVVISGCIPNERLRYKSSDSFVLEDKIEPCLALLMDTEFKVSHWLYGGGGIVSDVTFNNRNYATNPRVKGQPYWAKRISV
jgi:hypothetical protein